jgi:hypothetical protein
MCSCLIKKWARTPQQTKVATFNFEKPFWRDNLVEHGLLHGSITMQHFIVASDHHERRRTYIWRGEIWTERDLRRWNHPSRSIFPSATVPSAVFEQTTETPGLVSGATER